MISAPCSQPRRSWVVLLVLSFGLAGILPAAPQQPSASEPQPDRSEAYYHYTLAHLYTQLAAELRQRTYLDRAVEEYQAAIKADPESGYIRLKLVELYAQFDRFDDAVAEAQRMLSENPSNVEVRQRLGDIYAQNAFGRRDSIDQEMLGNAIQQFEQVLEIDPKSQETMLKLASLYRAAQNPAKSEEVLKKLLETDPNSSEGLTNLGALYLDMGEPQQAIEMLEKVRQAGRADQRALGALAQAYEQAGENAKAAELYAELVSEGGNTVPARRNLANNLLMAGRYDEALEQYQVLAGADPKNPENHLRLSQIYREKKRFEEARTSLQNAAALAPDSLEVKYNLVLLLESEGKSPEAIAAMEQLLKDSEKESYSPAERRTRAMFLEQLGVLNRMQERVEPAVEAFRAMSELDNDARPRALVQIIDTYRYGRDFDRAVERSKAAVGEFPTNRPVVSMAATVLAETGDAAAGAQFLEKLLDGSENDREILLSLAQVYEKGKMLDKAIEAVEKAEALAKTERERMAVWFTHGSVLERAKKYDEAEEKFNQVLKLDPDNAAALNYLGYMLADLNRRLDDAHDMIQKALDLDPDNGAYLDSLGWLYYRQERFELAERFLVRSLEQFKRDPVVHSHLGDVYAKLGRNAQAQEHWRRSLEEWERSPKADRDAVEIQKVREKLSQIDARSSAAESTRETTSKP